MKEIIVALLIGFVLGKMHSRMSRAFDRWYRKNRKLLKFFASEYKTINARPKKKRKKA